jgi:hypothetical protein
MDVSAKWNLSVNDRKTSKGLLTQINKAVDQQKRAIFYNNHLKELFQVIITHSGVTGEFLMVSAVTLTM